ncbi:MAG: hypothetical protein M3Q50_11190 [Chloroflexota bacterium]|nr:hypothetical protein [Chloroflexia bacterium]MDQ3227180.1 hypothetical protein [Chloroflexota bacterium]
MVNWYGIETEAEFRQQEWQRMVEADTRAAEAIAGSKRDRARTGGPRLPHLTLSLASLRALAAPRLRFASPLGPRRTAGC